MLPTAGGYWPRAVNIATDVDVIPPYITRYCPLLDEAIAAIEAKDLEFAMDNTEDLDSAWSTIGSDEETKSVCSSIASTPPEKYPFDYDDVKDHLKYHRLVEAGFIDYWHISPMGTAMWTTIEGDTEESATNIDPEADAECSGVTCFVVRLGEMPKEENPKNRLHDFLELGINWMPKEEWIKKIPLVRGDTLILPPFSIFRFEYTKDTLQSGGISCGRKICAIASLPGDGIAWARR